jgi:hypothetical protein
MHPRELVKEMARANNEVQKESDKLKKRFNKGEETTEAFLDEYLKGRVKYYQNQATMNKLITMQQ